MVNNGLSLLLIRTLKYKKCLGYHVFYFKAKFKIEIWYECTYFLMYDHLRIPMLVNMLAKMSGNSKSREDIVPPLAQIF